MQYKRARQKEARPGFLDKFDFEQSSVSGEDKKQTSLVCAAPDGVPCGIYVRFGDGQR